MMWMLFGIGCKDKATECVEPAVYSATSFGFIEIPEEWGLQEINSGFGHYATQNDLMLHFGRGASCDGTTRVRWPDASLTEEDYVFTGNQLVNIVQGGELDAP